MLVVPFPPGSTTDILGRILAGKLSEGIGQQVIVENKGGAGGNIGTEYVARAAPDGHTIVLGTVSTHAINASVYSKLPYDPIKDFAPIIEFGAVPQVLVVNASSSIKSVQDLIEYARARPGKVTYGSAGNGTTNHLSGALLGAKEKLQLVHVPYRGGAQAITDLLANEIVFMFYPYAALLPHIRAGTLRALGATAKIAALPDVPTLPEAKLADFEINAWFGVFAPARTPKPIVDKLNAEMARVITDPAIKNRLVQLGHRSRVRDAGGTRHVAENRSRQVAHRGRSRRREAGLTPRADIRRSPAGCGGGRASRFRAELGFAMGWGNGHAADRRRYLSKRLIRPASYSHG